MSRTATNNKNHHHHHLQHHQHDSNKLLNGEPHHQSKSGMVSACFHSLTDRAASSRIGQALLCRTLRALHSVEMTLQWMLPDGERIDDTSGKPNPWIVDKPSRPLPWILFLPAIVWMRFFIAGAKLAHRLTGRSPLYAWHIVVRLQSLQRAVRAIRHQGIRRIEQQQQRSLLQRALAMVGWHAKPSAELTPTATESDDENASRQPSSRASSVSRVHNDSIEDLLTKQYKSDGETSDESFQLPSDASSESETDTDYDTSDYDSLSHSDGSDLAGDHPHDAHRTHHGGRPVHRSSQQHHKDSAKLAISAAANKQKHSSHQPNESTSGVESLDAPSHQRHYQQSHRAPPPTADQSIGTEEDEAKSGANRSGPVLKADAVLRKFQEKNTGTPKRTVRELHSPTPGTPKITLVDFDEGSEQNNSLMLSESLILSDTVPLRAIENEDHDGEHGGDGDADHLGGFSAPEMTKSKRRRMKKKNQQQQQHQQHQQHQHADDENKEN